MKVTYLVVLLMIGVAWDDDFGVTPRSFSPLCDGCLFTKPLNCANLLRQPDPSLRRKEKQKFVKWYTLCLRSITGNALLGVFLAFLTSLGILVIFAGNILGATVGKYLAVALTGLVGYVLYAVTRKLRF